MTRRARAVSRTYPWTSIDPERRGAILLVGSIVLIVAVAAALTAYGYYKDRVQPKHQAVLVVGSRTYDFNAVEHRIKGDILGGNAGTGDTNQKIVQVLQRMETEVVTREAAKSVGVSASEAEVDAQVRATLNVDPQASTSELARKLEGTLSLTGFSLGEYRDMARAALLNTKLQDHFRDAVPAQVEHVNIGSIQAPTEAAAIQARDRLKNGESFASVAADVSQDNTSKGNGGDLGWVAKGVLPPEVDAIAFSISGRSDIIEAQSGIYIIEVRGKEVRPVEDINKTKIAVNQANELIQKTRDRLNAHILLSPAQAQKLALAVTKPGG